MPSCFQHPWNQRGYIVSSNTNTLKNRIPLIYKALILNQKTTLFLNVSYNLLIFDFSLAFRIAYSTCSNKRMQKTCICYNKNQLKLFWTFLKNRWIYSYLCVSWFFHIELLSWMKFTWIDFLDMLKYYHTIVSTLNTNL